MRQSWLALLLSGGPPGPCDDVSIDTLTQLQGPAVLVLGERHGSRKELKRAWRIVDGLAADQPVTVALEAIHEDGQPTLDAFAASALSKRDLPDALDWETTWGFPYRPYKKLVQGANAGLTVVAAGLTLGPKPDDIELVVPPDYVDHLTAYMGGHAHGDMPPEMAERFTTSMTWRDFRIAELAVQGWSGEGVLVVLTGRGHVEGQLGTNWQLERLVDVPVQSAILSDKDARCLSGDRLVD